MQEILSTDAWHLLSSNNDVLIIDVRTPDEWKNTGVVRGNNLCISIMQGANMEFNPNFMTTLKQHIANLNQPLLFLCRSGGRSAYAAKLAESAGFINVYNVIDGMEGSEAGKGWKAFDLPTMKWEESDAS